MLLWLYLMPSGSSVDFSKYISLNNVFCQDHLFVSSIEASMILLLVYRNGILFRFLCTSFLIHRLFFILAYDYVYVYYIIAITKNWYSYSLYSFIIYFILLLFSYWSIYCILWYYLVFLFLFSWLIPFITSVLFFV